MLESLDDSPPGPLADDGGGAARGAPQAEGPAGLRRGAFTGAENRIARRLTVAYLTALALIALLAASSHFLVQHVVNEQRDAATIVNVAGRQRMLSQRIGLLAMEVRNGDETARPGLQDAIDLMLRSQDAVTKGGDLGITRPLSPAARQFYFDGPAPLDPAVRDFIAQASIFAGTGDATRRAQAYAALEAASRDTLLPKLIESVAILQAEADQRVAWLYSTENIIFAALLVTLSLEAAFIFRPMVLRARRDAARLYDLATRDVLTGLTNRRFFMDLAAREWSAARRSNTPLAAVMIDLDQFKRINDRHGHATGDAVLRRFADIAGAMARGSDVLSRIGGEEFALLLPNTGQAGALQVAERIRRAIDMEPVDGLPAFTISAGIGMFSAQDLCFDDILIRADRALYQSKETGRNRVTIQPQLG